MRLFGRRDLILSAAATGGAAFAIAACSTDEAPVTARPTPSSGLRPSVDSLPGEPTVPPQTLAPTLTAPETEPTDPTDPTEPQDSVVETTVPETTLPTPVDPPDPTDTSQPYGKLGLLEIPTLKVKAPLGDGISMHNLDKGPGHWPGTALPGQQGNCVIAGHRTSKTRPFRHMDKLKNGDDIILTTKDGRFGYKVRAIEIVPPTAMEIVDQSPEYTATLFACHPPGSLKQRIVAFCDFDKRL